MKFISHRGNINGPNPARENSPDYIDEAIKSGFVVEIDVRRVGRELYLGHDYPQQIISAEWIEQREKSLLLHLKDFQAAKAIRTSRWHTFCHSRDPYTLTSRGLLWLHDLSLVPDENTIVPLMSKNLIESYAYRNVYAICSDWKINENGLLC
jgi:hypothetical protein